ncbi:MAG: 2,3-dihydroxy-2,3-dihydrophenylpropionate dehydrogenase [Actinoallomurus sp.]|jgi:NAD(P)-dependent dehydrogenase (short-subunit alcohol dehydrogenase family)|nr:2,3-dihydroxy-2,3-dihydrophenylpropionate dehydrogenase [Actinoallomurus sp.]
MTLLKDKRALIIGAGSGIGRAVAEAFVREGARTAVLELDPAKCAALESELPDCPVHRGDATSLGQTKKAVAGAVRAFGGLDVLVNCVGLFDFYTGIQGIEDEAFDAAFDEAFTVNVKSQLVSVKAAVPALKESGGSIILTTSTSSFYPGRGGILYVSSKFAVRGAVIALAHELAPEIRVNSVAPGGTLDTDLRGLRALGMNRRSLGRAPGREADLRSNNPLAVALTSHDHAGSYVFLASDLARGMTGMFMHPDGGIGVKR